MELLAMDAVLDELADEGYEEVFSRHIQVAEYLRKTVCELGYRLFPKEDAVQSPSVSAVYIPDGLSFSEFNQKIRSFGMGIGGSFGPLEGKISESGIWVLRQPCIMQTRHWMFLAQVI
jgi:aspartate aminotransferase-like enzyme